VSANPLLVRRGGCAKKKKSPFRIGADGVVAHKKRFGVSDHPVRSNKVASRLLLDVAATPPREEGNTAIECYNAPIVCEPNPN
jgi:hypothetical protein